MRRLTGRRQGKGVGVWVWHGNMGARMNDHQVLGAGPLCVDVLLGRSFDLWLHSYYLTGLVGLAKAGRITMKTACGPLRATLENMHVAGFPLFTIRCTNSTGSRIICFDARDQSDAWQSSALKQVDVYYKRSFFRPDADKLDVAFRRKVYPMNPMFATWPRDAGGWRHAVFMQMARDVFKLVREGGHFQNVWVDFMQKVKGMMTLSFQDQYEDRPLSGKTPKVLFQTRLWDPASEKGDWVDSCNADRVAMVRTLRARLGRRFVGGLAYTPFAREHYPDLLSDLTPDSHCRRPEFIALCRSFLVRVNIRALFDAIPYSLGESLAANNVIVSHPVRNQCATPLVAGEHYLAFERPDECADICAGLLDAPVRIEALRQQAYTYYCDAVRPERAMERYLNKAMEQEKAA